MRLCMWESFTTSLTGPFTSALLTPSEEHKACFRRVRCLTLDKSQENIGSRLPRVLALLRDNQLHAFTSGTDNPLHARLLLELLRRQANLKCLRARLDLTVVAGAIDDAASRMPNLMYVLPLALRRLTTLRVYIGDPRMPGAHAQDLHQYETAYNKILVASAPYLDCLEICGWRWQGMPRAQKTRLYGPFEYAMGVSPALRMLRQLVIADLDLSAVGDRLIQALSLDTLSVLRLVYCDQVSPFLRAFAFALRQQSKTSLQVLTIRNNPHKDNCANDAFLGLLLSFGGLVELELSSHLADSVYWKRGLCRHPDLRKLHISSSLMKIMPSEWPGSVPGLLSRCRKLHYFAYKPSTSGERFVLDGPLPTKLPYGVDESLDAVATAPSLRMLRLVWAPGEHEDELNRHNSVWLERVAQIAHRYATLVLMHLFRRGSFIRLLALSDESRWKQTRSDSNRHYYPHYFYKLEVTEKGVHVVILRDYLVECPEWAVFM
jgi:hypothetical protein